MKFLKIVLAVLLVLPLTATWGDGTVTLNWTPPIQNEDGSPLADADIAGYNVYCNGSLLVNVPNTGGTDSWGSGLLPTGDYTCTARTLNTEGVESVDSNTVNFTVDPSVPGAPTGLSVTFP